MKFLIVEPSPLPILIPLGPKYSPQNLKILGGKKSIIHLRDEMSCFNLLILPDIFKVVPNTYKLKACQ